MQSIEKINKFIYSSRFNEAFLLLKKELKNFPLLQEEIYRLNDTESTYRYMLDYISEGHSDPTIKDTLSKIRSELIKISDRLALEIKLTDGPDLYSSTKRMARLRESSFNQQIDNFQKTLSEDKAKNPNSPIISLTQANAMEELFNYVWTMYGASAEEYEKLNETLENPEIPDYLKSLLVSAIILGNISYYDKNSYQILLSLLDNEMPPAIKARIIIGVILVALLHNRRIIDDLEIKTRLILSEEGELKELFNSLLLKLVQTYDTKRIDDKMRNEVIPGLMKIKPDIIDRMRNLASDSDSFLSDDINPQWEELIENSEVGDKLKEINDMQMEGADVMVTAFSNLKGFPFFNKVYNWFLPFEPGNFIFENLGSVNDNLSLSHLSFLMCDSDIHSFLLSLSNMPEGQRKQMFDNIDRQMKEAKEALSDAVGETDSKILSKKIRLALQDLYRFFKFYRKKEDFQDPFGRPFVAENIEPLINVLGIKPETILAIAEFYLKNKYYQEAESLFKLYDSIDPDYTIWEKIGFCLDHLQRYEEAVDWYKKAEIIDAENQWLIKRLAITLKNAGQYQKAIPYYEKALEFSPENYHLIMSAGQCYLEAGMNQDAIKQFYHALYLKPEKSAPLRGIAWAELTDRNFNRAIPQYQKLMESPKADKADFLNAAHAELASGNFRNAIRLYKKFIEKSENKDITELVLAFRDDSATFKKLGIQTSDLRLVVDKIRYDFFN